MMNVRSYSLGPVQTNCYIVSNKEKECIVFDPGEEAERLIKTIRSNGLKPLAIFLTHAHFDHIGAVDAVREVFDVPVWIHEKEVSWLADPTKNGSSKYPALPDYRVAAPGARYNHQKEQQIEISNFCVSSCFTPGHSPGYFLYL